MSSDGATEYTLYCFAQSGNCYKVALALELAGADWAPRFVDYFGGETRTPRVSRASTSWARRQCWSIVACDCRNRA